MWLSRELSLHPCGLVRKLGPRELSLSGLCTPTILQVVAHAPSECASTKLRAERECAGGWGVTKWSEVVSIPTSHALQVGASELCMEWSVSFVARYVDCMLATVP